MTREKGNIVNLIAAGICVIAMTAVMAVYLECIFLVRQKSQVSQLARKYILKMETTGCLTANDRTELVLELERLGVTQVDLTGTTMDAANYSEPISLEISGKIKGEFPFEEKRVSTSKN
nr:hypothetical protein [uncultured Acetatifactor sp.]